MPLYKRTPFTLLEKPNDLKAEELVFQVRFTKEIFRDYGEYLKRMNLYRQRVWTCKITGKTNLTYEEAMVSEKQATEKVQQFPKELVEPVLRDVQFSMLSLRDLVSSIAVKLRECLLEGTELYGRKNNRVYPCKIVKVLQGVDKTQYQVAWLDKDKKVTESAVVNEEDLIKKLPFARDVLKSFIRESTCRNVPWVLHDKLARKHGISTDPPEELKSKLGSGNDYSVSNKNRKRKTNDGDRGNTLEAKNKDSRDSKRKRLDGNSAISISGKNAYKEDDKRVEVPIKYPIDDLLVEPAADDPAFTLRPSPSREFSVPMDCVGDMLMVWNFCSSFSRLLNLSPFTLEDFENALCHKDCNVILMVEAQSALLRLLIKDEGDYYILLQKKKRKPKITLVTWTDYLCDFLEMISVKQPSVNLSTIRRGHYGLLDIHVKLGIFRKLVEQAYDTDIFREKLDEFIEERHALAAADRGEALEEGRKRREEKELSKVHSNDKQLEGCSMKSNDRTRSDPVHNMQNGDLAEKQSEELQSAGQSHRKENSTKKQIDNKLDGDMKKQMSDVKLTKQSKKALSVKVDKIEAAGKSREQRKENLEREMERRVISTNPLGKDRDYNRYWFFRRDARIFVESSDSNLWGYYSTKDELDSFIGSLNLKGEREMALKQQLDKHYSKICTEIQKRSKEVAHRLEMEDAVFRRSTRVRAPPRENPALAFLNYVNKWKEE